MLKLENLLIYIVYQCAVSFTLRMKYYIYTIFNEEINDIVQ